MNVTPLEQSVGRIGKWSQLSFFNNERFTSVCRRLRNETRPVLPAAGNILRAFELTRPEYVRVVIVGQDPYPHWNPRLAAGLATGLAFAVPNCTVKLPSSLSNILGKIPYFRTGQNLEHWAGQGVLLLNTTLTIPVDIVDGSQKGISKGKKSHRRLGWKFLIKNVLDNLESNRDDMFFIFFGSLARKTTVDGSSIIPSNLLGQRATQVIRTGHPSRPGTRPDDPCWKTFKESDPFTDADNFFRQPSLQQQPIAW